MNELFNTVKNALRVSSSSDKIDTEVKDIIEECLEELKRIGVVVNTSDPMIKKAIKAYAKAHYGYEKDSEKYLKVYESCKVDLLIVREFGESNE